MVMKFFKKVAYIGIISLFLQSSDPHHFFKSKPILVTASHPLCLAYHYQCLFMKRNVLKIP